MAILPEPKYVIALAVAIMGLSNPANAFEGECDTFELSTQTYCAKIQPSITQLCASNQDMCEGKNLEDFFKGLLITGGNSLGDISNDELLKQFQAVTWSLREEEVKAVSALQNNEYSQAAKLTKRLTKLRKDQFHLMNQVVNNFDQYNNDVWDLFIKVNAISFNDMAVKAEDLRAFDGGSNKQLVSLAYRIMVDLADREEMVATTYVVKDDVSSAIKHWENSVLLNEVVVKWISEDGRSEKIRALFEGKLSSRQQQLQMLLATN